MKQRNYLCFNGYWQLITFYPSFQAIWDQGYQTKENNYQSFIFAWSCCPKRYSLKDEKSWCIDAVSECYFDLEWKKCDCEDIINKL